MSDFPEIHSLYDESIEEVVIGAILLEKDAYIRVEGIIRPSSFNSSVYREIYTSCQNVFRSGKDIDLIMVTEDVKKRGKLDLVGGAYKIATLTNRVASSVGIEEHAGILREMEIRRDMRQVGIKLEQMSPLPEQDPFELIQMATDAIDKAMNFSRRSTFSTQQLIDQIISKIDRARENHGISGVPSMLSDLDNKTGGFQNSDLIIIAGRPGQGKTSLVMSIANNMAKADIPVGIITLEMTALQVTMRRASIITGVMYQSINMGKNIFSKDFRNDLKEIDRPDDPLYISEDPDLNNIIIQIKLWKSEKKVKMVFVDYLQRINVSNSKFSREEQISHVSSSLKQLAKDLDIPIVAIASIGRGPELRGGDKKPIMADLRGSSQIESDADLVMFCYRPEYYGFNEGPSGESYLGKAYLLIEKHRNGPIGDVEFDFEKHRMLWKNSSGNQTEMGFGGSMKPSKLSNQEIADLVSKMDEEEDDETPF